MLSFLVPSISVAQNFWKQLSGPTSGTGGKIFVIATNPSGHIFAGTYGGAIYRSTDNGESWTSLKIPSTIYPVASIGLKSNGYIFSGVSGVGIARSTNNGASWTWVNTGLGNLYASSFAFSSGGMVFAGTGGGVFRSSDDGATWSAANSGLTNQAVSSLAIGGNGYLFAATNAGVFRSTDGANSWAQVGLASYSFESAAINSSGHIFAGASGGGGVFRSTDNGNSWTSMSMPVVASGYSSLGINFVGDVFAGCRGCGVSRSTNNGENWAETTGALTDNYIYALAINSSGYVFAGTGTGMFRSVQSTVPVAPPQNLTATPLNGKVLLRWNKNTEANFLRYRVHRSTAPNPTAKVDSTTGGINDTTRTITGLVNGTTYYFRLTAVDAAGNVSDYSNNASATPNIVSICVSRTGSDVNVGTPSAPLRNIQTALSRAGYGDTVKVAAGTYNENLTPLTQVILKGGYGDSFEEGSRDFILRRSTIGSGGGAIITDNQGLTIDGFLIDGTNVPSNYNAIAITGGYATLTHNILTKVHNSGCIVIRISSGAGALIKNNTLVDNALSGGGVSVSGIYIASGADPSTLVRNNIITTTGYGLSNYVSSSIADYNCVNYVGYNYSGTYNTPGPHDINTSPKLVYPAGGDYRLKGGSPCIDGGDPSDPVWNEPTPNGGRIDMGAFGGTVNATKSGWNPTTCVSNNGSDANSGSAASPYQTIQYALTHAMGDTIKVATGTYTEGLITTSPGYLRGGYSESFSEASRNIHQYRTTIQAVSATMWYDDYGVDVDGFFFNGMLTVANYALELHKPALISHNVIMDVKTTFAYAVRCIASVNLVNNVFYNNYYAIYLQDTPAASSVIKNNIAANNNYAIFNGAANGLTSYNCYYNNAYGNYSSGAPYTAPGIGEITLNPQFRNAAGGDFRLQGTSPCINAGDPSSQYNDPDGSRNDMGVFYYDISSSTPSAPTLSSPSNGATAQPTTLTLSWSGSTGATKYHVQVSTISAFTSYVVNDSALTTTSKSIGPSAYGTAYYWRVRAGNSAGWSSFSSSWSFTTAASSLRYLCVSVSGNDANSGTASAPLRNIQTALTRASSGDTVKVVAGTYVENLTTSIKVVLRGGYDASFSESTRDFVGNKTVLRPTTGTALSDGLSSTIDGLVVDGTGGAGNGIVVTSGHPTVTHNVVYGMSASAGTCIQVNTGASATIRNNTVANSRLTTGGTIVYAIYVKGNADAGGVVQNNIAYNSDVGIYIGSTLGVVSGYNCSYSNSYRNFDGAGAAAGDFSKDPKFRNASGNDFYLSWDSPCIDAGDPSSPTDPDGTRADVGAYYYPGGAVPSTPSLTSPSNGATSQAVTLTLSWGSSTSATKYHLQLSLSSSFTSFVVNDSSVTGTSKSVGPLTNGKIYYWRLRAGNSAGWSAFSSNWSFATIAATPQVMCVSLSGNDANSGTASAPLRNIQTALTRASSGDTVKVAAGNYEEILTTTVRVVLRGGYNDSFNETARDHVGNKSIVKPTAGTALTDGFSSTIDGLVIDASGGAAKGIVVTAGHAIVTRNVVYGVSTSGGSGIEVAAGSATVMNNTVVDNKLSGGGVIVGGITVRGNADGAGVVLNNIAYRNNVGIVFIGATGVALGYNCSYLNTYYNFDGVTATATDFSKDPILRSASAYDFRLSAGSPCIDAGDPSSPLDPDGTRADIGAYYYVPTIPPTAPSLSSPPDGATSQPTTLSLAWGASAGATKYHLQVSTAFAFTSLAVNDSSLAGTSASVGPLTNGTTYYWRVRAANPAGWGSFSTSWSFAITAAAQDYYVDATNGTNASGNGSQANPWKTITYALNQVSGSGITLHVAAGTYNTGLGEAFPIVIKNGVSMSGAGIDVSVLDAQGTNTVVKAVGVSDPTTTVQGFTIQGGGNSNQGGGLFISAGSVLRVDGCNINANNALTATAARRYGGGIYILNSSPTIANCDISGNVVMATRAPTDPSDFGAYGGGIAVVGTSSPQITQNTIRDNEAQNSFFALAFGAGIYVAGSATPRIEGNSITGNTLHRLYATSGSTLGAGIYVENSNGVVTKNTVAENGMAADYGSLTTSSGVYIAGSSSKPKLTRNVVARNADHGIWCAQSSAPTIVNNTIAENGTDGIYLSSAAPDSIVNNIFALNSNYGIEEADASSDPGRVSFNLFYANSSGLYRDEATTDYFSASLMNSGVVECKNNLDGDPAFVDLANGDYHLRSGSPAIDAGNPGSPLDPDGTRADIGAFYYKAVTSIPSVPSLSSPANNANLQPTTLSLSWGSSAGATKYHLQVSITSAFSTFVVNDSSITGTSSSVGPLANGTVHYWRVRAGNSAGWSSFSTSWSFTTVAAVPPVPNLLSPSNGVVDQPTSLTLNWTALAGAQSYHVQVSGDSLFRGSLFLDDSTVTGTTRLLTGLIKSIKYYWHVRAKSTSGYSAYSERWSFDVVPPPTLPPPSTAGDFWQQTNGPFSSFIQTLVIDPSGRLFAGTGSGGLFRSTDNGWNWTLVKAGLTSTNVASLAFGSSGYVFAGTGTGVYRSTDGGGSWTEVGGVLPEVVISLAINSSGHIFAGTWYSGVFRSTDNGESWTAINSGLTSPPVTSLAINSSGYVFAANGEGGVFRSTNNGAIWTAVSSGPMNAAAYSLAIGSSGYIFAGTKYGVFRSTDNGGSWTAGNYALSNCDVRSLAINSAGHVFAGCIYGRGVFRSTDNGQTWATVSNGLTDMDANALAINSSGNVFAGTAGGVFRSTDNGGNWIPANSGLAGFSVQTLAFSFSGNVFAGTDDGLFRSTDNGGSWTEVGNGLESKNIRSLAINSSGHVFAGTWDQGVFRSTDNGGNWTALDTGLVGAVIQALAINSSGTIFAGTEYAGILRSMDNGRTWVPVNGGLTEKRVEALATSPAGYVFAGTNGGGVFRSTDNGGSWTAVNNGLGNMMVQSLGIDSASRVFAGGYDGGSLFRSTDNGGSWIEVNRGLPSRNVSSIGVNSSGYVFAATSDWGVFRSTDNGGNWSSVNGGLTNTAVFSLTVSSSGYVFAGTEGSGVFRSVQSTLPAPSPPNLTSPSMGATNQPTTLSLSWAAASGASKYHLQVSADPAFSTFILNDSSLAGTSKAVGPLSNGSTFYWRVRAGYSTGWSAFSGSWSFTTVATTPSAPSAPILTSPADGAAGVTVSPTLSWGASVGATSYRLQVSTGSTFTTTAVDDSTLASTSRQVGPLSNNTLYYWRVSAKNAGGVSAWSSSSSFTTVVSLPSAPTLITPLDNDVNVSVSPTLNWNAVSGATSYRLQVSAASDFAATVSDQSGLTSTSRTVTSLANGTKYYWRVSASNAAGTGLYSSTRSFTTFFLAPSAPVLSSPASGSTNQPTTVTLSWNASTGAGTYRLQVSTSAAFASTIVNDSTLTGMSKQIGSLSFGTTYYWRVSASSAAGTGAFSSSFSFTTAPSPPTTLTLSTSVVFPTKSKASEYLATDYRLVGLPGSSSLALSSLLSGTKGVDWQAYWDNGSASNYLIEFDGSSTFQFSVGRAFWVITKGTLNVNRQVTAPTLNSSYEAEIPLNAGWNLVTNPFGSTILWSKVQAANNTNASIYGFTGSFATSTNFDPYVGYYFYNGSPNTTLSVLKVPYVGIFTKLQDTPEVTPGEWKVNVALTSGDITDGDTWFGVSVQASANLDPLDQRKPRGVAALTAAYFERPDWDPDQPAFATDVRPNIGSVQQWNFTTTNEPSKPSSLVFRGVAGIPSNYEAYLVDATRARYVDLRIDSVYLFTPVTIESRFSVLVGTKELVLRKAAEVLPTQFVLSRNFPNPFNPSTSFSVDVPVAANLTLKVYNTLGQMVRSLHAGTLQPGRHWFQWDGRDDDRNGVPSGAYYCRLTNSEGRSQVTRMLLIK